MIYAYNPSTDEIRKIEKISHNWVPLPELYATIVDEIFYCQKLRDITIKARCYTHTTLQNDHTNHKIIIYVESNKPLKVETRIEITQENITLIHEKPTYTFKKPGCLTSHQRYTFMEYNNQITDLIKNEHTKYLIDIETLPFKVKE